jgi:hypothetical protein
VRVIPTFYCGFWRASVRGSVILSFSPPNKMRSKFTVSGTEKHGVPKTTQFVGGSEAVLEMSLGDEVSYERAGLKINATLEIPDLVELNTVA